MTQAAHAGAGPLDVAFDQAMTLHRAGRLAEAETVYRRIIAAKPDHFDSLHLLGVVLHQKGDHGGAVRQIDAALMLNAHSAAAHSNRGSALKELKRYDEALESYDRALAIRPEHPEVLFNRGGVLQSLERVDDALASFDRALAARPDYPEALINRGTLLQSLDRNDEALANYDAALALNPNYAQAHNNRSTVLRRLDRLPKALDACDKAIALRPAYAEAHFNRGHVFYEMRRFDDALACFDRAIRLKPDYAEAYHNRGNALRELGRLDEAAASFNKAIVLKPGEKYLEGALLFAKMHVCDWRTFDEACAHLIAAVRNGEVVTSPFILMATPSTPQDQLACARIYMADKFPSPLAPVWRGERYAHERIRVAYLSADFHEHATAYLMAGVFESHDRSRFETIAVSFGPPKDSVLRRRLMRSFDRFIDVRADSDDRVAALLRELEVDIAVDLKGFSLESRIGIFARRPAPVQVTYQGFPATLGTDFIDYFMADAYMIPPERRDTFAEKIAYLPDTSFTTSYQSIETSGGPAQVPTRSQVGLPNDRFVFCSFNHTYKITPEVFDIWMRLLQQIDGSVLWLFEANAIAPNNLREEAKRRGVSPDRLIFAPKVDLADHLARQGLADLFLDTFPVNAHTTASDALWTGLPLITCSGATFVSRVAGSLLNAVGLPDLVTGSLADYEALALALARDPGRLAVARSRLARQRETSPLFDTVRLTRHVEAAYVAMWERQQRGEAPQSFSVSPIRNGAPE